MKTTTVALALRAAIEEGEASRYVEDFDFESHLEELKAKEICKDF